MTIENIYSYLAEILDVEQLGDHDSLTGFDTWDSLAVLSLLAYLDKEFEISLYAYEIEPLTTVGELMALIRAKTA